MAAQKARGDNPRAFSFSSLTCPDAGPCTLEIRCPQESFPRRKGGADFVLLPDLRFAPPAPSRRARCRPGEASCVAGRSALYATNSSSRPSRQGGSLYPPGIELGRSGWGDTGRRTKKTKARPPLFSVEKTLDSLSAEFSQAAGHIMDQPSRAGVSFCPFPGRQHQCWLHGSYTSSIRAG